MFSIPILTASLRSGHYPPGSHSTPYFQGIARLHPFGGRPDFLRLRHLLDLGLAIFVIVMAPQSSVPPSLPPSVEEAYRRKCVQLKNRTSEVEDANDAARLRLARIKRQVEKLRIERAFLLEQLAKRTSTNVEDSEGSPSPPPTPADIRSGPEVVPAKAKDKPLRIKRGHRKSAAAGDPETKAGGPSKGGASPASESQSQSKAGKSGSANGTAKPAATEQGVGFRHFEEAMRPGIEAKAKAQNIEAEDEDWWIDEELAREWEKLPATEREEWEAEDKADLESSAVKDGKQKQQTGESGKQRERKPSGGKVEAQDDDIEMVHYDTEDQEQANKGGDE
ncbi:HMG box protein [Ophiocordyceps camponoti-floridani]|uniref:HMG box protein n=1 Tax=Ophiocordyceps camponoti-floridani TaxID=2030778 RepID=A0A8H4Q1C8_9HYPO|nr:HMG box protein [Ophiocordyceps camponoti-floridani]